MAQWVVCPDQALGYAKLPPSLSNHLTGACLSRRRERRRDGKKEGERGVWMGYSVTVTPLQAVRWLPYVHKRHICLCKSIASYQMNPLVHHRKFKWWLLQKSAWEIHVKSSPLASHSKVIFTFSGFQELQLFWITTSLTSTKDAGIPGVVPYQQAWNMHRSYYIWLGKLHRK